METHMKTGSKTPYEIRLDLLNLAQTILHQQHQAKGAANGDRITTAPTSEEIIAEADKLNAFVSRGNPTH